MTKPTRLFKFTAAWCGPCKKMDPYWGKVVSKYPLEVSYFDAEADAAVFQEFNIKSVPTFLVLDDEDKVLENKTGAMPESALNDWLAEVCTEVE